VNEYCDQGLEDNYAILPSRENDIRKNQTESRNNQRHINSTLKIHKGLSAGSLGQFNPNTATCTSQNRFSHVMGRRNTTAVSLDSEDIDQLTKQNKSHLKLSPGRREFPKL